MPLLAETALTRLRTPGSCGCPSPRELLARIRLRQTTLAKLDLRRLACKSHSNDLDELVPVCGDHSRKPGAPPAVSRLARRQFGLAGVRLNYEMLSRIV